MLIERTLEDREELRDRCKSDASTANARREIERTMFYLDRQDARGLIEFVIEQAWLQERRRATERGESIEMFKDFRL